MKTGTSQPNESPQCPRNSAKLTAHETITKIQTYSRARKNKLVMLSARPNKLTCACKSIAAPSTRVEVANILHPLIQIGVLFEVRTPSFAIVHPTRLIFNVYGVA